MHDPSETCNCKRTNILAQTRRRARILRVLYHCSWRGCGGPKLNLWSCASFFSSSTNFRSPLSPNDRFYISGIKDRGTFILGIPGSDRATDPTRIPGSGKAPNRLKTHEPEAPKRFPGRVPSVTRGCTKEARRKPVTKFSRFHVCSRRRCNCYRRFLATGTAPSAS